ncbi:putative protease Do-like 14 [Apium graveolens]|uniref:putative protease Do-like 14 n=1 Tax=Apium graveolens TaxID=4045 RepID=UPI003D7BA581
MYDDDKMETAVAQSRYYYDNLASERPKFDDVCLNIYSKRAALKVAPSVVAIGYYSDMTVIVYSWDGKSYEGKILAYDCYYNLVAISFHSESPLLTATLAYVHDSMSLQFTLVVVNVTIVNISAQSFSRPTAESQSVVLINHSGEIIGIAYEGDYYGFSSLPFMPINIAYKWWEYCKKYGKYRRPFLGMKAANLYAADLDIAERLIQKFHSICEGIIIEKVMKGFSAEMAGLHVNDVIIECCGKTVHSFLEFFEIIWDKVGDLIQLTVVQQNNAEPVHLKMLIVDATPDRFNRWPCDSDYNDNYYGDYYDNYNSKGFD